MYLNNNFSKLVPFIIDKYINQGYIIQIEIIPVEYHDEFFLRVAHRLALLERVENIVQR